ncbi:tyrosine-type recombinase/integrase [Chloroflexota bacterium]
MNGFLSSSPLINIKVTKGKPPIIQPYSLDEIQSILKICDLDYMQGAKFLASRNRAMVLVLLDSGMRLAEMVDMNLIDINQESGWITIIGKGDKERIVRIGSGAQKALWIYLTWRPEGRNEVWLTEEGQPIKRRGIQHMITTLKRRAGISTKGTTHRFRHSFAINALKAGCNIIFLQALLGHEDLSMVKRYTAALTMEDALKAHIKASPVDFLGLK